MDVRGFLIDLDGVLYIGDQAIDGAQEASDCSGKKTTGSGLFQTQREHAGKRSPNGWHGSGLIYRNPQFSPRRLPPSHA